MMMRGAKEAKKQAEELGRPDWGALLWLRSPAGAPESVTEVGSASSASTSKYLPIIYLLVTHVPTRGVPVEARSARVVSCLSIRRQRASEPFGL